MTALIKLADESGVEPGGDGCEDDEDYGHNAEVHVEGVHALAALDHDSTQRVHEIRERVQDRDGLQPPGRHGETVDGASIAKSVRRL
jgi:hypothetical protein